LYIFPGLYIAGTIFIDRNSGKGKEELNEAMEKLKMHNVKLWIFPEGILIQLYVNLMINALASRNTAEHWKNPCI
jgi:hypothetical protein